MGIPTWLDDAVYFVDAASPLIARVSADKETLVNEGEFGGPVRREVGGGGDGEMDVGGKSGVAGEEA